MKASARRIATAAAAALVLACSMSIGRAASATAPGQPQPDPAAQRLNGAYLFKTYCASCHGARAMGDGPLASSMRRRPPNLTEIARRNNGVFSTDMISQVIDGRRPVRGHGGPDMPVWGDAFLRTTEGGTEEGVKLKIQALVAYLESIQLRDGF